MATKIYLGNPTTNIVDWIRNHSQPVTHEETWYKYNGDTGWRTVLLGGTIALLDDVGESTGQIENPYDIVAIEIGTGTQANPVTSIGENAFLQCNQLTSVTIPDSVMSIEFGAFMNCSGLTSMTIPDSVTNIINYAFFGCTGLMSVTIPDSVTNIENDAFYNCTSLTSVTINCFDVSTAKSQIANNQIFGLEFHDPNTNARIEKTFLVTCTNGAFSVTFGTDYSITFTDL